MFKKFWDFIKRIFGKKKQALPEGVTENSNEFVSAISGGGSGNAQFLENNDELILTIHTNENDEKNVNIQILRNGEEINKEEKVFDKEKVIDYLKNIEIDENEPEKVVDFEETEDIDQNNIEIHESKIVEEPLDFESEKIDIDENITSLIDFETEENVVVAEAEEVAEKINEASTVEFVASNVIEFPKINIASDKTETEGIDENLAATMNYIRLIGFSDEEIKDLINKKPEISKIDSDIIVDNLNYLTNAGLKNIHLYNMIKENPALLIDDNVREIDEKIELFNKKKIESSDVYSLYIKNPDIILLETKQLEQSIKVIKKFYRTNERIQYIMKYFPHAIGMTNLEDIRKCVEKI